MNDSNAALLTNYDIFKKKPETDIGHNFSLYMQLPVCYKHGNSFKIHTEPTEAQLYMEYL